MARSRSWPASGRPSHAGRRTRCGGSAASPATCSAPVWRSRHGDHLRRIGSRIMTVSWQRPARTGTRHRRRDHPRGGRGHRSGDLDDYEPRRSSCSASRCSRSASCSPRWSALCSRSSIRTAWTAMTSGRCWPAAIGPRRRLAAARSPRPVGAGRGPRQRARHPRAGRHVRRDRRADPAPTATSGPTRATRSRCARRRRPSTPGTAPVLIADLLGGRRAESLPGQRVQPRSTQPSRWRCPSAAATAARVVRLDQLLRRGPPPRLDEQFVQLVGVDVGQHDRDPAEPPHVGGARRTSPDRDAISSACSSWTP